MNDNKYGDIRIGKAAGSEVGEASKDGTKATILQVQMSESADVRKMVLMGQAGEDYTPPVGARLIFLESGTARRYVVASRDTLTPTSKPGERELYSSDGTEKQARLKLKANGKILLASALNSVNLYDEISALLTANSNLVTALTTFATGLNPTTLVAQGAALASALPSITSSLTDITTKIGLLLDNAP